MLMIFLLQVIDAAQVIRFTNASKQDPFRLVDYNYKFIQEVRLVTLSYFVGSSDLTRHISFNLEFQSHKDGDVQAHFSCLTQGGVEAKDQNAKNLLKNLHSVRFEPGQLEPQETLICSILKLDEKETYIYTLEIVKQDSKQCLGGCGGTQRGVCLSGSGICKCHSPFIDLDCSKSAKSLIIGTQDVRDVKYLFYQNDAKFDKIAVQFETNSTITVYQMHENFQDGVGSQFYFDQTAVLSQSQPRVVMDIDLRRQNWFPEVGRNTRVIFTLNSSTAITSLKVTLLEVQTTDPQWLVVYLIAGIGGIVVILLLLIYLYLRFKNKSTILRNSRVSDDSRGDASQLRSVDITQVRQKSNSIELLELIPDVRFEAIKKKSDVKNILKQRESCSICLAEYEVSAVCKFTPCLHLFHSDCLRLWLQKNDTCPICRKKLNF